MSSRISRRRFLGSAVAAGAGWAILPRVARSVTPPTGGVWLAGDLHCHTTYSGDVWSGPGDDNTGQDEFYTLGWTPAEQIAIAETRGLDYLAITDHGDVRALRDPGYRSDRLTLIPGYEHSLSRGHAGCLGVDRVLSVPTGTDAGARALADAVHAEGGIFILNHPYYSKDEGESWGYSVEVKPDSIEVWNIGWPYRGANPFVSTSNNYKSLPFWERYLDRWGRMPANGGSDNHWRSTTAVQGVGQPTTWVYSSDRSWRSILEAIAAGRTTVSAEPPALGGARLFLEADDAGSTQIVGGTVAAGAPVTVRARIVGAPGHLLQLVVDGVRLEPVPALSHDYVHEWTIAVGARVRAEVFAEHGHWMAALSSPIYAA